MLTPTLRRRAQFVYKPTNAAGYLLARGAHLLDWTALKAPSTPAAQRLEQALLDGILRRREVSPATHEDTYDGGDELPQGRLVHRRHPGRHSVTVGGSAMNGRTSSHSWIGLPPAPGAADSSPASSTARS
jgi:hypothetical protein